MRSAVRSGGTLIAALVAMYLFFLLPASLLVEAVERAVGTRLDAHWEQLAAVSAAAVAATAFTRGCDRTGPSVERLWTFVVVAYLATYAVFVPFFHLTSPAGVGYYLASYSLFALALAGAYATVYRDPAALARRRLRT